MINVNDPARLKYEGRFIDSDTMEPVDEEAGGIRVEFFLEPVPDEALSEKAGRLVCVDREYIRKTIPNDQSVVVVREVRGEDKRRFAAAYANFKASQAEVVSGTPIEAWPAVTRGQARELAYLKIRTVEALAGLEDKALASLGDLAPLREKARDWLAVASGAVTAQQARAEAEALRKELEALKQQIAGAKPKRTKSRGSKPVAVKGRPTNG